MNDILSFKKKSHDVPNWRKGAGPNNLPPQSMTANSRLSSISRPPKKTYSTLKISQTNNMLLNSNGKPLRREMAKDRYKLGTIIRAPLHEEDYNGGSCESYPAESRAQMIAKTITESPAGGVIHTKIRKFIVVALFDDHYLAIPLYSYKGDGLVQKDADEYVSVQDHRAPAIKPQSGHGMLYTSELEDHVDHYEPMTSAHFAHPVSRKYRLPVVYEGDLRMDSTEHLLQLFSTFMISGANQGSLDCQSPTRADAIQSITSMSWCYLARLWLSARGVGPHGQSGQLGQGKCLPWLDADPEEIDVEW